MDSDLSIPAFFGVLALLIVAARVFGFIATRLRLPSVVGELAAGVVLATIPSQTLREIPREVLPRACAELGVLLLLFDIGLELRASDLRRIGWGAFRVAVIGVVLSLVLVTGVSFAFGASGSLRGHIFVGATLAATSIGIAGRVLRELGKTQSPEGKVVLAAAVLDDVMSLVLLAVVTVLVTPSTDVPNGGPPSLVWVALRALGFLVGSIVLGRLLLPTLFRLVARITGEGTLLVFGLAICFLYSWVANLAGLAPAIGAFCAGLVIQPEDYRPLVRRGGETLEELLAPLLTFFVPIFFLLAGLRVDLTAFVEPRLWLLAIALVIAAALGKLAAGLGASGTGASRLVVGASMIPRGEVSLIFATAGGALMTESGPLVPKSTFSALVICVVVTALLPPLALRRIFVMEGRREKRPDPPVEMGSK